MADLEQRLRALASDAFPPAPDVRTAVAARIASEAPGKHATIPPPVGARDAAAPREGAPPGEGAARQGVSRHEGAAPPAAGRVPRASRGARRWARPRVLALALALVLVPGAAIAAVPATRNAVLDWLGLAHVHVERVPRIPELPRLDRADLGRRAASVRDASRRAGFAILLPRALGTPDAVYVTADGIVTLAYDPRAGLPRDRQTGVGLLVTELRAGELPRYFAKMAGPGTRVERVRVGRAHGVFLSGAPHELLVERPGGAVRPLAPRLAGNALAFERGELVIRLEGRLDRAAALALARSVRRSGG